MNMLSASDGSVTDFSGHYRYRVVASENPDLTRQKHFHTSWLATQIFSRNIRMFQGVNYVLVLSAISGCVT